MTQPLSLWPWMLPPASTMAAIAGSIAHKHGITVDEIRNGSQVRDYARPRQEACWYMHERAAFSWAQVARYFRMGDHTSAWHAAHAYAKRAGAPIRRVRPFLGEARA